MPAHRRPRLLPGPIHPHCSCVQVVSYGSDSTKSLERLRHLEKEVARLEGAYKAAADRAAAAEGQAAGRSETAMQLHGELSRCGLGGKGWGGWEGEWKAG